MNQPIHSIPYNVAQPLESNVINLRISTVKAIPNPLEIGSKTALDCDVFQ